MAAELAKAWWLFCQDSPKVGEPPTGCSGCGRRSRTPVPEDVGEGVDAQDRVVDYDHAHEAPQRKPWKAPARSRERSPEDGGRRSPRATTGRSAGDPPDRPSRSSSGAYRTGSGTRAVSQPTWACHRRAGWRSRPPPSRSGFGEWGSPGLSLRSWWRRCTPPRRRAALAARHPRTARTAGPGLVSKAWWRSTGGARLMPVIDRAHIPARRRSPPRRRAATGGTRGRHEARERHHVVDPECRRCRRRMASLAIVSGPAPASPAFGYAAAEWWTCSVSGPAQPLLPARVALGVLASASPIAAGPLEELRPARPAADLAARGAGTLPGRASTSAWSCSSCASPPPPARPPSRRRPPPPQVGPLDLLDDDEALLPRRRRRRRPRVRAAGGWLRSTVSSTSCGSGCGPG